MKNYQVNEGQLEAIYNHEDGYTTIEETKDTLRTDELLVGFTVGEAEEAFNNGEQLDEELYQALLGGDYQGLTEEVAALVEEYHANKEDADAVLEKVITEEEIAEEVAEVVEETTGEPVEVEVVVDKEVMDDVLDAAQQFMQK